MKTSLFIKASMVSVLALSAAVGFAESRGPVEIASPVNRIFIPNGFDDNDNVEIVVHGEFANTCYQVDKTGAEVDTAKKEIKVWGTSLKYTSGACLQVVTPFIQVVKVGTVEEGDYTVTYKNAPEVKTALHVSRRTTESPDDYLYATVENANIMQDQATGRQFLQLNGHYPYMFMGCMVIREVRTYKDPADVMVVLPISEIVQGEECEEQPDDKSFEIKQGLSEPFVGEGLLHVRVLHGRSINQYVNGR